MAIEIRGSAPLLQVFDMPTALAFYRDVLGFEVLEQAPPGDDCDWAMLRLGGVDLMLNTAYEKPDRPPTPDPERMAGHTDFTLYFGCPDVDATYAHLSERGIEVDPPSITSYGFKSISLRDPDGYGLCFHWPADQSE
ncbi:MAG: VOC family protein [Acidobacteriota bacterium]|nr:MAG: VOC family protein [Acidobacteriota bacterium]